MLLAPFAHHSCLHIGDDVGVFLQQTAVLDLLYVAQHHVEGAGLRVVIAVFIIAEAHGDHAAVFSAVLEALLQRPEEALVQLIVLAGSVDVLAAAVLNTFSVCAGGVGSDVDEEKHKAALSVNRLILAGSKPVPGGVGVAGAGVGDSLY